MKLRFWEPREAHLDADLLSAYLDKQVAADTRRRVESHLAGCAVCQAELESLRQTVMLLQALPRVPVPRAFTLSEALAGIRRPGERPAWLGGLAGGLAAATAVLLVGVVAVSLLRPPTLIAPQPIAAVAPTAQPATLAPSRPTEGAALAVRPQATAALEKPREGVVPPPAVLEKAAPAAPRPTEAPKSAPTPLPATSTPTRAPAPTTESQLAAIAPEPSPTAAPGAAAAVAPALSPSPSPAASIADAGRSVAPGMGAMPPAPTATTTITINLPAGAGIAYTDGQALWALDRESGARPLAQTPGLINPLISSDRAWVAYQVAKADTRELWAVRWGGQEARLLLARAACPRMILARMYRERQVVDLQWVPISHTLALNVIARPTSNRAQPRNEIWLLDVETGARRQVARLETLDRPSFSPDGKQFVIVQRVPGPEMAGNVWLYRADGTAGRILLPFTLGPAGSDRTAQFAWWPDSRGLWAAVPDPDRPAGLALYPRAA